MNKQKEWWLDKKKGWFDEDNNPISRYCNREIFTVKKEVDTNIKMTEYKKQIDSLPIWWIFYGIWIPLPSSQFKFTKVSEDEFILEGNYDYKVKISASLCKGREVILTSRPESNPRWHWMSFEKIKFNK